MGMLFGQKMTIYIYIHCPIFPLIASHCVIAFVGSKDGFGVGLCDGLVG